MIVKLKEWSTAPGPRYKSEGQWSGEQFREEVLHPALVDAYIFKNEDLVLDLDGISGVGCAFLEEVFGGLIRVSRVRKEIVQEIKIKSDEEPYLIDEINQYIEEAK